MSNINIMFSICMPVYNVEEYIQMSVESVLKQKFSNWELVIIDDGSTDNSGNICDNYAKIDSRIHVVHKKDQGLLSARRRAIELVKGEYTVFLDSDDFWEENILETLYDTVLHKQPDIIFYSHYEYRNQKKTIRSLPFKGGEVHKKIIENVISCSSLNPIWAKCIRSDILKNDPTDYKVYYSNSYGEDKLQFLYLLTESKSFYAIEAPLINYRINNSSMMRKSINEDIIEKRAEMHIWKLLREYMDVWNLNGPDEIERYSAYCIKHLGEIYSGAYYSNPDKNFVRTIDWKRYIPEEVFNNRRTKYLSFSDKVKLWCMLHKTSFIFAVLKYVRRGVK